MSGSKKKHPKGRDMDYIEYLIEYGLTRQEATIYIELLKHGSMTGYEVSKETGISKSNVYAALKGLTQKGAAVCEEGEATRYFPIEAEIFCDNHLRYLKQIREHLINNQPKQIEEVEGYITIQSARHIYNKIYELLGKCEKRLYIMAETKVIMKFKKELEELATEGKKVVVLTGTELTIEGAIVYKTEIVTGQIRFITDSSYVVTGTVTGESDDTCLYSGQETLVNLVKQTIKNKMLLAEQ